MQGSLGLSRRPLYVQVCDLLAERITSGIWKPGSTLPNEQDLAREIGVSPGTLRKALDMLEGNRLIERHQGRGTYVTDYSSAASQTRFSNIRAGGGERICGDTRLLEQAMATADHAECQHLQLTPADTVLRTRRLRSVEGRAFMYEHARLAAGRLPGLKGADDAKDYRISALAQRFGVHLARATECVGLASPAREIAEALAVEPGATLLRLDRIICGTDGLPIEWRVGFCLLNNLQYVVEMN
ncbi:MAG: GntR family transcriptional regulator [Hyphomicrobiaceae bacterium]|nr:MAG: GntR family transcriptional regulator [Hyphomicrobiaceae bacterium]